MVSGYYLAAQDSPLNSETIEGGFTQSSQIGSVGAVSWKWSHWIESVAIDVSVF